MWEKDIQKILEGLNEEQTEAVKTTEGPLVIFAGPGSGKTHVLVKRAAYMIENRIDPENILLFTFTKKAANELKERVIKEAGSLGEYIEVGTYHSFCAKMLRKYSKYTDYNQSFTIYDTTDRKYMLEEVIDNPSADFYEISDYISKMKGRYKTPDEAEQYEWVISNFKYRNCNEYYRKYQELLVSSNAMDFDDLIFNFVKLLENNPEIRKEIKEKYKYIMADEAHDSSVLDLRLIFMLTDADSNICLILDDDQSIYQFRGSNMKATANFLKYYKNRKTVTLSTNYRSTKNIVAGAKALISNNSEHIKKSLKSNRNKGTDIFCLTADTMNDENEGIVKIIKKLTSSGRYQRKDIGVLYRCHYLGEALEEALIKNGIPVYTKGKMNFFERAEIKDLLSYVISAQNPKDVLNVKRSILWSVGGIGVKTVKLIEMDILDNDTDILSLSDDLNIRAKEGLIKYQSLVQNLRTMINKYTAPRELLEYLISELDFKSYIEKGYGNYEDSNISSRLKSIDELLDFSENYENIEEFMEGVLSSSNAEDSRESKNEVNLMTMHGAKGLEFPVVILPEVMKGTVPHYKSETPEKIEEERRLFYVAMTRAEDVLIIIRPLFKNYRKTYQSQFVSELIINAPEAVKSLSDMGDIF